MLPNTAATSHMWLNKFKFTLVVMVYSLPVVSHSLRLHGLQYSRLPCPSPFPGVSPNWCSLHQWYHPAVSSSDTLFSFCPWSFPASGTFPVSHRFTSHDQNTGASASASVLPVNSQGWSPLRLTGLIALLSKQLSSLLQLHSSKASTLWYSAFFMVQLSQPYLTTGKTIALTILGPVKAEECLYFSTP